MFDHEWHADVRRSRPVIAPAAVRPGRTASLLELQRSAGNRAVQALVLRQSIDAGEGTTADLLAERQHLRELHSRWLLDNPWVAAKVGISPYTNPLRRIEVLLAERGDSTLPDAPVLLTFSGTYLTMHGDGGNLSWRAVSGRPDDRGGFDYSPGRQRQSNVGPIPEGDYWLDPRQLQDLRDRWLYGLRFEGPWGTHRITIHPFDATRTFGRGGFFIHGGESPGSAGCIDLTGEMAAFAARLAETPRGSKVVLRVRYGATNRVPASPTANPDAELRHATP